MKTAFKIEHEDSSASAAGHVLIEVAHYGVSIVWFRKDPLYIDAVSTYNFPGDITGEVLVGNLQTISDENNLGEAASVNVFYNFKEAIVIPAAFHKEETNGTQLNLIFGNAPGSVIGYDEVELDNGHGTREKMYCVYRIPAAVDALVDKITSAKARHATSVQLKLPGTNVLQCTIFHNTIKVFLYNNNQLHIVQQYGYKTPADVVYHLLNTCARHGVSPADISLHIDGMIDGDSSLYQEIYKYFMDVHFNTVSEDIQLSPGIKEHPLHFISHLTELARCV